MRFTLLLPFAETVRRAELAVRAPARRRLSLAVTLAVGVGSAAMAGPAGALGFGIARLNSALGQPLDLRIPVQSELPGELESQCVRLLPAPDSDIPTLSTGRVSVERDGLLSSIRILSLDPINEPALRIVLEAGCQRRMQREYVLLIDPPVVRAEAPAPMPAPAAAVAGLELGEATIRAVRGRPLLIRVPLRGPEAPQLPASCVRTVGDLGDPPALQSAQARLVNAGSPAPVLEITTREALTERTIRVVAELGCERPLRREFDLLVEAPPAGETVAVTQAPAAAPAAAPRRTAVPPPPRPRAQPTPVVPATPPVAAAPAPAPAVAAAPPPPAPAPAPAAGSSAPPAASGKDRLVLATPEEPGAALPAAPAPMQTDEFVRKLDELASEVKRLRVELDAANQRNAVLTEKLAEGRSVNLGWAVAAIVSLLFAGLLWVSGRRSQPSPRRAQDADAEGPMTRIVGHRAQASRADAALAAMPPVAAPTIAGAAGATQMTGPLSDVRSQGDGFQVTEMGDEEAIRELYADFVSRQDHREVSTVRLDVPRPAGRFDDTTRLDSGTRFGDDVPATRMTVPLTTQLAVDIDLTPESTTQAAPATPLSQAATKPLELDLHLDLPKSSASSAPDRKNS